MTVVRYETPEDHQAIRDINDQAFAGSGESRIVEAIRRHGWPIISLVATKGSTPVGHIFFSPVEIGEHTPKIKALGLGPMAVLPQFQRQGIGSRLVEAGLEECARQGCEVVVVLGHTHFYKRFGFQPARALGLRSEYPDAGDAFMARELIKGVLSGRTGLVKYLPAFADV